MNNDMASEHLAQMAKMRKDWAAMSVEGVSEVLALFDRTMSQIRRVMDMPKQSEPEPIQEPALLEENDDAIGE